MKIGIVTMPLVDSYGGVLQNFALHVTLKSLSFSPITLDLACPSIPFWRYFCSWLKTCVYRCVGKKRAFAKIKHKQFRNILFSAFVNQYIKKTDSIKKYRKAYAKHHFHAFVVGSDQVWRPRYNNCLCDMFLNFCKKDSSVKRIAYAASFGVDIWEYTSKQTRTCSALAKKFDAISVREESGVALCKNNLGVDATWVLDPTLLLKKDVYLELCAEVPKKFDNFLAVYILDANESVKSFCEAEAQKRGLNIKYFTAGANAELSVPEWIAMFRDASYVVTDSFHGTVFSIIFGKEFKCFYNEKRGASRFESLLNLYNSGKLDEMREFSINWLKNALES